MSREGKTVIIHCIIYNIDFSCLFIWKYTRFVMILRTMFFLCYKNNELRFLIQLLVFLEKPSKKMLFRFGLKLVMDS